MSRKHKNKKPSQGPKKKIKLLDLEPCPKCGGKGKVIQHVTQKGHRWIRLSDDIHCTCLNPNCNHKSDPVQLMEGEDDRVAKNRAITIWNNEAKKAHTPAPRS